MKRENDFQAELIKELNKLFPYPDGMVLKNDSSYRQGIPDLTIYYKDKWATLECKRNKTAKHQANQDTYVEQMDNMSFSRFIYPENKEEVLHELQQALKPTGPTCVPGGE